MEDTLIIWMQNMIHKKIPICGLAIRQQALEFLTRSLRFKYDCDMAMQSYENLYQDM